MTIGYQRALLQHGGLLTEDIREDTEHDVDAMSDRSITCFDHLEKRVGIGCTILQLNRNGCEQDDLHRRPG